MFKYTPEPAPSQAILARILNKAQALNGEPFSVGTCFDSVRAARRLAFQGRLQLELANGTTTYWSPTADALAVATAHALNNGPKSLDNLGAFLRLRFPFMAQPYLDSVAVAALVDAEAAQDAKDAASGPVLSGFANIIGFLARDSRRTRAAQPSLAELLADPTGWRWVIGYGFIRSRPTPEGEALISAMFSAPEPENPHGYRYVSPLGNAEIIDSIAQVTAAKIASYPAKTGFAHVGPARVSCPDCNGSGMILGIKRNPGEFIHGGDYHECYNCEGTGEVSPAQPLALPPSDDASTANPA